MTQLARRNRRNGPLPWLCFLLLLLLGGLLAWTTHPTLITMGPGSFGFLATGPGGLSVQGHAAGLLGYEEGGIVTFTVPLGDMQTGIPLCDERLKETLDVSRYPSATLTVERTKITSPTKDEIINGSSEGRLSLHGVTVPVKFSYTASRASGQVGVEARLELELSKFDIERPCFLGVCVDDTVVVRPSFALRSNYGGGTGLSDARLVSSMP